MGSTIFGIVLGTLSAWGAIVSWKKGAKAPTKTIKKTVYGGNSLQGYQRIGTRKIKESTGDIWYSVSLLLGLIALGCFASICL
jgi:hypothetical protein